MQQDASQKKDTLLGADELVLDMGPQHPSTHGVLRVKLKLDGERVRGTECVIGYLHRGVEKIAENRTYQQFAPYVDRMDYVAAVSNGLGYCEAVEKLLSVEAPLRARVIRTILTELQRIASHLLWLGTHALDIGALTPLFYCMREREEILKIFEKYCGARLTTHAFRIGGLQYEAYDGFEKDVERFCKDFERRIEEYVTLLTGNSIWIGRTRNVGVLNAADCIALGASGPILRAAGVNGICAKPSRMPPTIAINSKSLWVPTATPTIATWCAWKRCASPASFAYRPSKIYPKALSWAKWARC